MHGLNMIGLGLVFLSACHLRNKPVNGQEITLSPGDLCGGGSGGHHRGYRVYRGPKRWQLPWPNRQECQMTPVIHVLQHPGCVPKPIPSYACIGKCSSYVQVSGSKIWQMERSCNCCQESGEREATVVLFCPKAKSEEKRFRKVSTKAPLECMCRPCGIIEEHSIIPQEIAGYADDEFLQKQFRKNL